MKKKRFSAAQIVAIPNQAEHGIPEAELISLAGSSEQTDCRLDVGLVWYDSSILMSFG